MNLRKHMMKLLPGMRYKNVSFEIGGNQSEI